MPETPPRRGLVIVRCGRETLHPLWLQGDTSAWDLHLCPYQAGEADWPAVRPGHKWDGLHAHLTEDQRWRNYDYIWLPDDDLACDSDTITRFFEACRRYDAAIAAPALSEDSHWSIALTMRNRNFATRAVSYIEVMAPCFRRDVLEQMLPTFTLSHRGAGWGIDYLWAKRLGREGLFVFDSLPVRHTRPILKARNEALHDELYRELQRFWERHDIRPVQRTARAWDAAGVLHEANHGAFLWRYVQGYAYMIEKWPWMLMVLVRAQTQELRLPRTPGQRFRQRLRRLLRRPDRRA